MGRGSGLGNDCWHSGATEGQRHSWVVGGGAGVWCAKEQPPQRWGNLVKKQESPILPLLLGAGVPSVVSAAHTVRLAIVESGSIESLEN